MNRKQIMSVIRKLAKCQGFYSSLLDMFNNMSEEEYEICMSELESKNFGNAVDFIVYIERGVF